MSTVKKVVNNSAWFILCRVIKVVLGAVVSIFSARLLGAGDFGVINYSAALTSFIMPFVLLGFNSILVKEFMDDESRDGTTLGTAIISSLCAAMIGMGACVGIAYLISPDDKTAIGVTAMYSITLIFHATELIQYWFQAKYRAKTVALVGVLAYTVVSVYKILLLVFKVGVYWFALSNALDFLLISAVLMYIYKKERNPRLTFSWSTQRRLLRLGYSYAISSFMINVFTQVDKLMIKSMLGNEQNGLYSVAVACSGMFVFLFVAVIDAMRPYILEGKKTDDTVFENRFTMLYSIVIYLGALLGTAVTLGADIMIYILYGTGYTGAGAALQILIWSTVLSCIGGVKDIWFLAESKQKYLLFLNTAGVISNVTLNFILLPRIGILGAAIATVSTQFLSNILLCIFFKELRRNVILLIKSLNPLLLLRCIGKWKEIKNK